jgi:hypothetical protein
MKVIKLSTTREAAIWLTPEQLQKLNDASVTLRSSVGDAYFQSHGAVERDHSTYTDSEIDQIIADRS